MKSAKKESLFFILLLTVGVSLLGCSASGQKPSSIVPSSSSGVTTETSALKTVISKLFSAPDRELTGAFQESETRLGNGVSEKTSASSSNRADTIIQKHFGNYFTGRGLDSFVRDYLSIYQGIAAKEQLKMSTNEIQVNSTAAGYDFTANVKYRNDKTAQVSGDAQFTNGKLSSFRISSDGGLFDGLRSGT